MTCITDCKDIFDFASNAKQRIEIFSFTAAPTATGGQNVTWVTLGEFWSSMRSTTGRELFVSSQLDSRVTHKIIIRYQSALKATNVTGKYKIEYDGRNFEIKYIHNLNENLKQEGKTYQEIHVEENAFEFDE